ncbi:MAG: FitA-like ribbon-helix-helix domain-containing protein [Candidatus Bipolaricaulia bacterium]
MPNVLIRNVPESVLRAIKERALQKHRSLQQELKALLEEHARVPRDTALVCAREIRDKLARSGRVFSESVELLREDRAR